MAKYSFEFKKKVVLEYINGEGGTQYLYFQWNTKKKMEMRHNGQFYKISPWALTWEEVNVNVAISSQFFGWVFALGTGVKILAPENVVERMKQEIDALHDFYNK